MAVRRTARLRREYLYRKSLEGKEKELYERKERLKAALAGEEEGRAALSWEAYRELQPSADPSPLETLLSLSALQRGRTSLTT